MASSSESHGTHDLNFPDPETEYVRAAPKNGTPLSAPPGEAGRDIFECANQLGGYVGPDTDEGLARFLLRESNAAADLANEIVRLRASLQTMQARAEKAERERDALREALKPSGETKAEYSGEFTIAVERHVNSDEEVDDEGEGAIDPYEHVTVPWTTIKEIMAAISERAARSTLKGGSNG